MSCYCLTEPSAGSDANSGKAKAVLTEDGKHYIINGQKMWISNGGFAHIFITFARIGDDKYLSCFIIEKTYEGVSLGNEEPKLGLNSSSTRMVYFEDVKVPVENLLGGRGKGFYIAMNALNGGRIKVCSATLDNARSVVTDSVKYANERKQFKVPISSFGAIQAKLADQAMTIYAGESLVYRSGFEIENNQSRLKAEGKDLGEAYIKGISEYAIECSIAKVFGSEGLQFVTDEGIQIYGGMGYSGEAPMEAAYRDARIYRIYEGTNEINRIVIVGFLMKSALNGQLDFLSSGKSLLDKISKG